MNIYVGIDTGTLSIGIEQLLPSLQQLADKHCARLIQTGSYGLYGYEPLIEIAADKQRLAFANVSSEEIDTLINADGSINQQHPRFLGTSQDLPLLACQRRFTFKRVGLIEPLNIEQYQQHQGLAGLQQALHMSPQQIIDTIKNSGLRGRGGAGFPTGIKLQTVKDTEATQKYIVCNADEGDSGTFADRLMMEADPFTLIEGMCIAARAVGATQGFVYLRCEYPLAQQRLQRALELARQNQLLGSNILGSDLDFDITIHMGAEAYICGEETSLLESLEGKRGMVRYKPPLPAIQGFLQQPTALNNVITLCTLPEILRQGADAYQQLGYAKSRGTLTVQLGGSIRFGGLYEVPFGTKLEMLINDLGGGCQNGNIKAVQVGGPLGAYFPKELLHLPLDYETFVEHGGMIGHGGVVVFADSVDLAEQAQYAFEFCAHESCGKCTPCRIGSTRGAELIASMRQGKGDAAKQLELVDDLCDVMEQTSLCALGGMTPYPVKSAIKHFPEDFANSSTPFSVNSSP